MGSRLVPTVALFFLVVRDVGHPRIGYLPGVARVQQVRSRNVFITVFLFAFPSLILG